MEVKLMGIKKVLASVLTTVVVISSFASTSLAAGTGWQQDSSGWRYYTSDSTYVKGNWKEIGGKWYFFNYSGYAVMNSWYYIDGKVYHFDSNGAMEKNKWIDCGKANYSYQVEQFIKESGTTDTSWNQYLNLRDWRYVGSDGAAYTGWAKLNGKWYFFEDGSNSSNYNYLGLMSYGICYDTNHDLYAFDKNGQYETNTWVNVSEEYWIRLGGNGKAFKSEWLKESGKWYYFDASCKMIANTSNYCINGKSYAFDKSGVCTNPSGSSARSGWSQANGSDWYYYTNGTAAKGWKQISGNWYYFDTTTGVMYTGQRTISGKQYYFASSGEMQKGWIHLTKKSTFGDFWIYAGSDGVLYANKWLKSGNNWYYFASASYSCAMVCNRTGWYISGLYYDFDANGVCTNPSGRKTYK